MTSPRDPFESYLLKAENLYQAGDIVQAGQIWQAILKKSPNHSDARAGLYKVKIYFDARATQDGLLPTNPETMGTPSAQVPQPPLSSADEIERLLRDGCTLFDMGESQDALKKWEQILEIDGDHQLAQAYIKDARKDLGLEATPVPLPANPVPEPIPASAAVAPPSSQNLSEQVEQLLREGTQLFDMGMPEEACQKWELLLTLAPGHKDALAYLEMAKRELAAPPRPPAAPTPTRPTQEDPEVKLRSAEGLLHQGKLEESAFLFQEILNNHPQNFRALQGIRQTQVLLDARQHTHAAPSPVMYPPTPPVPWAEPEESRQISLVSEPEADPIRTPVAPPVTLTTPLAPSRKGLEIPKLLRQLESEIPPWLKTPKFVGSLVGAVIIVNLAFLWFRAHRKDVLLTNAVEDFRTSAQTPATRNLDALDLSESPAQIRKEAESLLEQQPLFAYYRGQELIRLNPLDGPAAQLMGRAGTLMGQSSSAGKGTAKEVEKLLASGDLDAARRILIGMLQTNPDDAELKAKTARVMLALSEIYALKERWGDAEDQLKDGHIMFPTDKTWRLRLQILGRIKELRGDERKAWVQLLG